MQELDELVARVDSIVSRGEPSPDVIEEAAAQIRAVENRIDRSDPEACYAIGYCWYNLPEHWRASETWFRQSLDSDPSHLRARLYLGHVYFDDGQYEEAQEQFRSVLDELTGPAWRRMKVEELDICCTLYVSAGKRGTTQATQLLAQYAVAAEEEAAVPAELVRCVAHLCDVSTNQIGLRMVMDAVANYLEISGYGDCFVEEAERIRLCRTENDPKRE